MHLVQEKISRADLEKMSEKIFGNLVKTVVLKITTLEKK